MSNPPTANNTNELRAELGRLRRRLESRSIENSALIDSLDEGLVVIGPDGMIRQVNAYALKALGMTEAEMVGQWFSRAIVAVDDNGQVIDPLQRPLTEAFIEGKPVSEYTNLRRRDGSSLPVLLTASPIIIDDKPAGAIDVFRDLTRERQLDLAKNDFVSLASHQLRTPASGVKAILHMLRQGDFGSLTELQERYLQRAIDSNDRQLRVIEDLLDVARVDSGTLELSMDYLDVVALVRSAAAEQTPLANEKRHRLTVMAPERAFALIDGPKIEMVVDNLLSNAIKYTPDNGRIRVYIEDGPEVLQVKVEDNGIGIADEHQTTIFSKFGRIENQLLPPADSTGLGLYLAKQVALLHNGDIQVVSRPGHGSTFTVHLPKQRKARSEK